ncbi:HNH endonuclease signature motif containing protein [Thalassospira lucentensis]|uniref:HNH endonuclease signature motif containing protein n=1 Tax=Thalassospira lucentensis TaxID=168935 RepID=UPI00142DC584|nr:HNH endonuclease signature motif containing protein [Thalassospira lucentensis]NIZ03227.1 HNH endonuclease [Thalassospira lucentensis]
MPDKRKHRVSPPKSVVSSVLIKAFYRCAVCPEHRKIADIHHIDKDPSNNDECNLIGVCKECHADIHETSTMRRKIAHGDLIIMKENWQEKCTSLANLISRDLTPHQWLYAHLHRLGPLYKQITGKNILSALSHRFKSNGKCLNTLWHNEKSSISWTDHMEMRDSIDDCISIVINSTQTIDLALIETGAVDPRSHLGSYVCFTGEFSGKDIPDQNEFVESDGQIFGPQPTLRREVYDGEDPYEKIYIETCLLLDARYFYSTSAFLHLGERGRWTGIGLLHSYQSINSENGIHIRYQLNITPLCIGSTAQTPAIPDNGDLYTFFQTNNSDFNYRELLDPIRNDI